MKSEYVNTFIVNYSREVNEVTLMLKQDTLNSKFMRGENGERTAQTEVETVDMFKAVLSSQNARQLAEILLRCLGQPENPQNEI